jgi:AcrR family transcriptional regulator
MSDKLQQDLQRAIHTANRSSMIDLNAGFNFPVSHSFDQKPLDEVEQSFYLRTMAASTLSDTRTRLLDVTERLIYQGGIGATGMDLIVKTSGVARKSIYRYFSTKEELIAAALHARDQRWMQWFIGESSKADSAEENLLSTFDALAAWFAMPDFRGCAFINAAGEIADAATPIRIVAKQHKTNLYDFLRGLTEKCQAGDPARLAMEFLILIDGAITVALVTGDQTAAHNAKMMAQKLLS